MTDDDKVAYPERFLLLGMLLFKDILPILAVDHKDSKSQRESADSSLYTRLHPERISPLARQTPTSRLGRPGELGGRPGSMAECGKQR